MSGHGDQWSLLIPVKRLELAKSRLDVEPAARSALALAMAHDTVSAALSASRVAEVVVVTDDGHAGEALAELGARVVADRPDAGLNPALGYGASLALMPRIAALSSDLPSLRAADLDLVLLAADQYAATMVADASGVGTTLLAARELATFVPRFGVDSRQAHVGAGVIDLTESAAASVRHDVDTLAALRLAVDLGVGPETAATIGRFGIS